MGKRGCVLCKRRPCLKGQLQAFQFVLSNDFSRAALENSLSGDCFAL